LEEIEEGWRDIRGLIICGTHNADKEKAESYIKKIQEARENKIPFLGICWGHQLAAIEYARNIQGIEDATSEEFGQGTFVVKKLPELNVGLKDGESYWNNYDVVIEWEKPEHFITVPYHPEYQSSKEKPHFILKKFIDYAKMAM
jgi:CTP synthase (UTP-ammonia lyase)